MSQSSSLIVLTGVTRGLGRAMAAEFIERGHRVIGCGRSEQGINELRTLYPDHRFDGLDVTDEPQVRKWSENVLSSSPAPDYLINNAAIINANAPLWEVPVEEFGRVMDVNIKGVHNLIRNFVPAMIARGSGVIVNFSSGWGRSTSPEVAPYCASKWAIEGLTQALAQELPNGLAAIPLNPGVINTDMLQSCFGGSASSYPSPEKWASRAVPKILSFTGRNNGESLTI